MAVRQRTVFTTVRTEGGLLPADLLQRISDGDSELGGLKPEDYHLGEGERLNEAINRSWSRLVGTWANFQAAASRLTEGDAATGLTRERWLLILFQELSFGRLPAAKGLEAGGKSFAISHYWMNTPIHLIGYRVDLDKRSAGVAGAARSSPHSLVQEFLNRDEKALWGFVSNGLQLRLLRDNARLTRQAYAEFDLQAMMQGEVYSDFVLLWLICHQSRVETEKPEECWLERWSQTAQTQGARALETLRDGVEDAIKALGGGFLAHPLNETLRGRLRSGALSTQDFYRQILRLVYRLLFLFAAEDRNLLLLPTATEDVIDRYVRFYSTSRLRTLAQNRRGTRHADLFQAVRLVMQKLGEDSGCPELALPALGSFLFSGAAVADIGNCEISNRDLLDAIRSLALTKESAGYRPVDYKNLGTEELGSVYESLLELHPDVQIDAGKLDLGTVEGHERKTSGSYYTPDSLVQCLLDSALEPVVEAAIQGKSGPEAEKALLFLKVCDPAVGSGHFLVGAAHRLAKHLARIRALAQGESEPSPLLYQGALRDVIGRCLYGVDINPMSAELCRVSLWLEALEPGKPLSFLDHHIRVGNSLLGATPELIAAGLPDEAFTPIEGDDRKLCSALKKRNRQEREGQQAMFHLMAADPAAEYKAIAARIRAIEESRDDTIEAVMRKSDQFQRLVMSPEYWHAQLVADAWCSAFVWKREAYSPFQPITTDTIRRLEADSKALSSPQESELERLARQYQFFHWHLVFPEVIAKGGFDCVLSNPPWEHAELKEKEWFSERMPEIADARNAAIRKAAIEDLRRTNQPLFEKFLEGKRFYEGTAHFLSTSGRFPLCGRGRINLYAVFAETMRQQLNSLGRMGTLLPSGIATDDNTKYFFQSLVDEKSLVSLFEFENEGFFVGAGQGHMVRFALTTICGAPNGVPEVEFMFQGKRIEDLSNVDFRFSLTPEDIQAINPNSRTCAIFRTRRDAELTRAIYRRVPILIRDNPLENVWNISFKQGLFNTASDSGMFRTLRQLLNDDASRSGAKFVNSEGTYLPLYEAKMIHQFNHRHGDFSDAEQDSRPHVLPEVAQTRLADPNYVVSPFYWVESSHVFDSLSSTDWKNGWFLSWRDVTDARASARTTISAVIPRSGVGHSLPLMFPACHALEITCLLACLNSFPLDYVARQKVAGLHLTYQYLKQLAVLPPALFGRECEWEETTYTKSWILPRVLELTYTAWDLAPFAQDCGCNGAPFRWDEERRFLLRCELDAAFFHLYLSADKRCNWQLAEDETAEDIARLKTNFPAPRDAIEYIMETFLLVKSRDFLKYGDYRTKLVILDIYDRMQLAIATGEPYQTLLDPPPADPRCCHPPRREG